MKRVYKGHKVYKVRGPPRGAWSTAAHAADKHRPKDTSDLMDFMDFMDFMDLTDFMDSLKSLNLKLINGSIKNRG